MDEQKHIYKLTIYVAAPGTDLKGDPEELSDPRKLGDPLPTSTPGHMFYVVSRDNERNSYGFAPIEHGSIYGAGHRVETDLADYVNPHYERTLEITAEQYDRLKSFGDDPRSPRLRYDLS